MVAKFSRQMRFVLPKEESRTQPLPEQPTEPPAVDGLSVEGAAMSRTITREVEALMLAIKRAGADLEEAKNRMLKGQRPASSFSGRILSQSALDADSHSSRLEVLLDLAGTILTEEQVDAAYRVGVKAVWF